MKHYTYLLINTCSVLVPFIASFHPASSLYKRWYALLPAIAVTTVLYCIWDDFFTRIGVWGFEPDYVTGHYIGKLPLEEVLFFVCIPYACVFTFDTLAPYLRSSLLEKPWPLFSYSVAALSVVVAFMFYGRYYTMSAFILLAIMLTVAQLQNIKWLPRFYVVYGILILPFLIVNGLLTGTGLEKPVVWYNGAHIMGPRILTIPVEDVFYGMGMVLANVWIYQKLRKDSHIIPH